MMMRLLVFATLAMALAGFGVVAWTVARPSESTAAVAKPPPTVQVVVAAHDIGAGKLLKADDLTTKDVPRDQVPASAVAPGTDGRGGLVGGMVRRQISSGSLVTAEAVMKPSDHGFLAAVLQPGMRAVTVGVDAVSGTAGLIWPGDHVDVIMTETIETADVPLSRRVSAEPILLDARVIAIDQDLVQGAEPGVAAHDTVRTVTLEVTPEQEARVQVAARIGRLSLAVNSTETRGPVAAIVPPVWAGDVSHALAAEFAMPPVAPMLRIYQGSQDPKEFRF